MTEQQKGYDYAYLKETVGEPLSKGLAQLALVQPDDPVDFIGNYLLKYVENAKRDEELKDLAKRKDEYENQKRITESKIFDATQASEEMEKKRLQDDSDVKNSLLNAPCLPGLFSIFLNRLCECIGARGAYIGRKVRDIEDEEKQYVHWIYATENSLYIVDQKESEESGVTLDVFNEVEDENATPDEDGNVPPPARPGYVHIENVMREPRMVFFGVPKLGAYLASALLVKTCLHSEAVKNEETGEISTLEEDYVLGADTIGQARKFTDKEIKEFIKWKEILIEALENFEKKTFEREEDGKKREAVELESLKEEIASKTEEIEAKVQESIESSAEDEKTLKESQTRLALLTELFISIVPRVHESSLFATPYMKPVVLAFATALTALGVPKKKLYNVVSQEPDWEKTRMLLRSNTLLPRIESFNPASITFIDITKSLLEKTSVDEVQGLNPLAGCLFAWTQAAVTAFDAIAETEQAEDN